MAKDKTVLVNDPEEIKRMYVPGSAWASAAGIAVIVLVVGLAGGIFIGRASASGGTANGANSSQQFPDAPSGSLPGGGQRGGAGIFGGGITGDVTEISDSSITLKEQRTGGLVTYQLTSDTEVTDNGDDAVITDVKVGDTVMVSGTDDADDNVAATITLNPTTSSRGQFQ